MKKILYTVLLVLIKVSAFSQVRLTQSNYYVPGQVVNDIYVVTNTSSDSVLLNDLLNQPVTLGTNLEGLFDNYNMIDTIVYSAPNNNADFPTETLSFNDENGMVMHININDERATCLGISGALTQLGINDNINIVFDNAMDINEFPSSLNAEKHSVAQGKYLEKISALQSIFNSFGDIGPMIYSMLSAEYDSIKVAISVDYTNRFDEAGNITLNGTRMQQGTYEYLREYREYTYINNLFLHRIGSSEFTNINECTVTNELLNMFLGTPTVNIGEALDAYMGLSFPMSNTSTKLNYWIANDNYPIVEINVNQALNAAQRISIRYGENTNIDSENIRLAIFPNPTSDYLNIAYTNQETGKIKIYSVTGALVQEEKLTSNYNSVNISKLNAGNYFYEISFSDKQINGKFIKQ